MWEHHVVVRVAAPLQTYYISDLLDGVGPDHGGFLIDAACNMSAVNTLQSGAPPACVELRIRNMTQGSNSSDMSDGPAAADNAQVLGWNNFVCGNGAAGTSSAVWTPAPPVYVNAISGGTFDMQLFNVATQATMAGGLYFQCFALLRMREVVKPSPLTRAPRARRMTYVLRAADRMTDAFATTGVWSFPLKQVPPWTGNSRVSFDCAIGNSATIHNTGASLWCYGFGGSSMVLAAPPANNVLLPIPTSPMGNGEQLGGTPLLAGLWSGMLGAGRRVTNLAVATGRRTSSAMLGRTFDNRNARRFTYPVSKIPDRVHFVWNSNAVSAGILPAPVTSGVVVVTLVPDDGDGGYDAFEDELL
jgi:hypothetical protein